MVSFPYTNWDRSVLLICFACYLLLVFPQAGEAAEGGYDFLAAINTPENLRAKKQNRTVVAVVDDGFLITHEDLQGFLWENPLEIPGNFIDDDGNGKVDDRFGWNVSDNDGNIMPPAYRRGDFFHGTHLAGLITTLIRQAYGSEANRVVSIMAAKAISDHADNLLVKDGYKGIEYAIEAGADIILCAWNVGHISEDERCLLRRAEEKGILIVSSAGNFPSETESFPAAADSVLGVAALDENGAKMDRSNFGSFVDLSAPGASMLSSGVLSDTDHSLREGTSQAAALVAAAAVVVMTEHPEYSLHEVKAALKNSADSIKLDANSKFNAKLGAGKLNVGKAALTPLQEQSPGHYLRRPQGYLVYSEEPEAHNPIWQFENSGRIKGFWFKKPKTSGSQVKGSFNFYQSATITSKPYLSYTWKSMPDSVFIAADQAAIRYSSSGENSDVPWLMEYRVEPIDFRTLYCSGVTNLKEAGSFEDGSGPEHYSPGTDCKWQISAPEGYVIRMQFSAFDTEANTDLLYFFNGTGTHEKIMAIFSGPNLPPEFTTWTNTVLVWFVTNNENQGQGWRAEYTFVKRAGSS